MLSKTEYSAHRLRQGKALRRRREEPEKKRIPTRPPKRKPPAEDPVIPPPAEAEPPKRKSSLRPFVIALELLLLLALAYGIRELYLQKREIGERQEDLQRQSQELDERTREATLEVRYLVPGQEDLVESVFYGDRATLREAVELEGYTFLGWEDREGKLEDRRVFPVYRDTVYKARYALAFETGKHIPYLHTDAEGVLDVTGPVSMGEFTEILYLLLDIKQVGTGKFLDVKETDSCYKAAAALKDLGVLEGSRLHPDETLTRGEMLRILFRFFPMTGEDYLFQDLDRSDAYYPYFCSAAALGWIPSGTLVRANAVKEVTRGEFARIMNHVLGRDAKRNLKPEDVGTILDVPASADYYDDVVEAVIPHEYRIHDGIEEWTESKALPLHKPGFFFAGVKLHYIAEDGSPAANGNFLGLDFNRNGEVTSGDEELDGMLYAILEQTIDPATMEPEEMLRAVYDYVVHNFTYRYGSMKEKGAEGWGALEARRMLENGGGNCYGYAALFYELARFVGYDAKLYAGLTYGSQYETRTEDGRYYVAPEGMTPHSWVEINIDGTDYLFDTEYECRSSGMLQMFKRGEHAKAQYGYTK